MVDYSHTPRSFATKVGLVLHTWRWFIIVRLRIGREPIPSLVASVGRPARVRAYRQPPARLKEHEGFLQFLTQLPRFVVTRIRQPVCVCRGDAADDT